MFRRVGFVTFIILFLLVVSILCVRLNTELSDNRLAKYRLDTAKKRFEVAEVELENALYKRWVFKILYKDVEFKDEWIKELEQFKKENGYYD